MPSWGSRWQSFEKVSASEQNRRAKKALAALEAAGIVPAPVVIEGTRIAHTFWGRAFCEHIESHSDYASRLPRGRAYVRSGAVLHLGIGDGRIDALVRGTEPYTVRFDVQPLPPRAWRAIVAACSGQVASLLELLAGQISADVMRTVSDRDQGLFPGPREIEFRCSCPDSARMCKHVAAVLYGVGARLDHAPELLFVLRGVDARELAASSIDAVVEQSARRESTLGPLALADLFGIELVDEFAKPLRRAGGRARRR